MTSLYSLPTRPRLLAGLVVVPPIIFWLLITVQDHDGRVVSLQDYLLLIARDGWQPFTLAVCVGLGPLVGSVVGTLLGVQVSARPRQVGELSYLLASGKSNYRNVMATRAMFSLGVTCLLVLVLAFVSYAIGWVSFGTGSFSKPSGEAMTSSQVTAVVIHCVLSICCIGLVSCSAAMAIGVRYSVQASVAAGISLPLLQQAVGAVPLLGDALRFLPVGHYHAWTNRMVDEVSRGTEFALYLSTALWVAAALALLSASRIAAPPRVGAT